MNDYQTNPIAITKPVTADPRIFFAAQRTLLAWIRTGLAVMAFGLVLDKFSLLLATLAASSGGPHQNDHNVSHYLGIVLILVGTLLVAGAQYSFQDYLRKLPPEDVPEQAIVRLDWFLTFSIVTTGVLLTVHLVISGLS